MKPLEPARAMLFSAVSGIGYTLAEYFNWPLFRYYLNGGFSLSEQPANASHVIHWYGWIATAALGYADGFHRSLSGRGTACFDGTPVPLVGRISMDLTTFDVTDHPSVQTGCWLEVLGPHLSPDDVAEAAGTNAYEILTSLGRRFQIVYRAA